MTLNQQYSQAKDIVLKHLQNNNITKVYESEIGIDVFKLATDLGFDVRGAFFEDPSIGSCLLVNEDFNNIEGFNSNKIITYSNPMSLECIRYAVAFELGNYFLAKQASGNNPIVFGDTFLPKKNNKRNMASFLASAIISPLTFSDSSIEIIYNPPVKTLSGIINKLNSRKNIKSRKFSKYSNN